MPKFFWLLNIEWLFSKQKSLRNIRSMRSRLFNHAALACRLLMLSNTFSRIRSRYWKWMAGCCKCQRASSVSRDEALDTVCQYCMFSPPAAKVVPERPTHRRPRDTEVTRIWRNIRIYDRVYWANSIHHSILKSDISFEICRWQREWNLLIHTRVAATLHELKSKVCGNLTVCSIAFSG